MNKPVTALKTAARDERIATQKWTLTTELLKTPVDNIDNEIAFHHGAKIIHHERGFYIRANELSSRAVVLQQPTRSTSVRPLRKLKAHAPDGLEVGIGTGLAQLGSDVGDVHGNG